MNIKKKIKVALLLVCISIMTLGAVSTSAAELQETPGSYFRCSTENGEKTIEKYTGTDTTVVIPSTINGKPVVAIGNSAFSSNTSVKNVIIGDNITSIGDVVFYNCSDLESVTIGNNVKTIGVSLLESCSNLKSVTFGNNVESIGGYAFYDCSSLKSIVIPNSVTSIGEYAFNGCTGLTDVVLSDKLEIIDDHVFYKCTSLKNIVIPENVKTIKKSAFKDCSSLESVIIPNNTETIEQNAFIDCAGLKSVIFGSGLKTIGTYAFDNCPNLEKFIMCNGVKSIGEGAFGKSKNLKIYFTGTENEFSNAHSASVGATYWDFNLMNKVYNYSAAFTETLFATADESSITTTSQAFLINQPAEVTAFGTIFIPLSLHKNGSTDTAIVTYDNSEYDIKDGQKYEAMLTDIPEDCKDWGIVAISFIQSGDNVSYSTAKYMSVNDTTLESVTTAE